MRREVEDGKRGARGAAGVPHVVPALKHGLGPFVG
jgi:hypothetical protein